MEVGKEEGEGGLLNQAGRIAYVHACVLHVRCARKASSPIGGKNPECCLKEDIVFFHFSIPDIAQVCSPESDLIPPFLPNAENVPGQSTNSHQHTHSFFCSSAPTLDQIGRAFT